MAIIEPRNTVLQYLIEKLNNVKQYQKSVSIDYVIDEINKLIPKEKEQLNDSYTKGHWCIYRDWETDRKSTRLNSSHSAKSRMPSSA